MRAWLAGAACVALLSGCADLGYLGQSVSGHFALMRQTRTIDDWLADPATPPKLRERLQLAQQIREFAVRELGLPDNASYRSYADLHRPAAVWNVVAAPELSLTLKTWCYPVMGCVGYRGFFDRAQADALAASLRAQGLDVLVYGVPAYSTLGWSNWLGGDPLLNTFALGSEAELARLVFHELAHQVAFAAGDTGFNESFATAVERTGLQRWQAFTGRVGEDAVRAARRQDVRALTARTRAELAALYAGTLPDADKRVAKAQIMVTLRQAQTELKSGPWRGDTGYDAWFARANNASLAIQLAYDGQVGAFLALLDQANGELPRFYAEVHRLAALPKAERDVRLAATLAGPLPAPLR